MCRYPPLTWNEKNLSEQINYHLEVWFIPLSVNNADIMSAPPWSHTQNTPSQKFLFVQSTKMLASPLATQFCTGHTYLGPLQNMAFSSRVSCMKEEAASEKWEESTEQFKPVMSQRFPSLSGIKELSLIILARGMLCHHQVTRQGKTPYTPETRF